MNTQETYAFEGDFERDGFVVLKDVVTTSQIKRLRNDVGRVFQVPLKHNRLETSESVDKDYAHLKAEAPGLKSHAYDMMKHLTSLWQMVMQQKIVNAAQSLSDSILFVDHVNVRIDDSSNDWLSPMHQETMGQMSFNTINLWMPLQDVNEETGTIKVIPGSHKNGIARTEFYPEFNNKHGIKRELIDESAVRLIALEQGNAILFDGLLFHGSSEKRDENVRWTVIARFNSTEDTPYLTEEDAPKHIEQVASD